MRKVKKKKLSRNKLIVIFSIIFCSVLSLTVVYAALSTTLDITGRGEINAAEWDIRFENATLEEIYGDMLTSMCSGDDTKCGDNYFTWEMGRVEKFPTLSNTSLKDFSVSVTTPEDLIIITYKVINYGSISARLDSIIESTPVYTSKINSNSDIEWAKNNTMYVLLLDNDISTEESMSINDILCPGDTAYIAIGFGVDDLATTLPSDDIYISNLGVEYVFVQENDNACPS